MHPTLAVRCVHRRGLASSSRGVTVRKQSASATVTPTLTQPLQSSALLLPCESTIVSSVAGGSETLF